MSISLERAVDLLRKNCRPVDCERLPLTEAAGCILAEPVTALTDQPPFDRSPLDGYALLSADTVGASRENPVLLSVVGRLTAGDACDLELRPGQAVRVMTGAVLPPGADCVLRQEDTDYGADKVAVYRELRADSNYVHRGEDFLAGEVLLPAGSRLDAAAVAVAAGAGAGTVAVRRRIRAAVFSTGDELVQPGAELPAGKIYDSNLRYLSARFRELGVEVTAARTAGDSSEQIRKEIRSAAETADLILTTGGVSVGEKDLLPEVAEQLSGAPVFHGLAMKPGSPALFFRCGGTPVLSLSGNPFAAAATFELLARPLLAELSGCPALEPVRAEAVLVNDFRKKSPGRRFIRGCCLAGKVSLPEGHSSGQLRSMLGCNCLVDIPAGTGELRAGDTVSILLL